MQIAKRLLPTVALLTLSIGSAIALSIEPRSLAQSPPQPTPQPATPRTVQPPFRNPFESKILEQLNLTPDQQQKIQAINAKYGAEFEPLIQSAIPANKAFQQAMNGDASDDQLRQLHRQQMERSQQMSNLMFERELAIRNVLTPDQRKARSAIMRDPVKMRAIFQQLSPTQTAPSK